MGGSRFLNAWKAIPSPPGAAFSFAIAKSLPKLREKKRARPSHAVGERIHSRTESPKCILSLESVLENYSQSHRLVE